MTIDQLTLIILLIVVIYLCIREHRVHGNPYHNNSGRYIEQALVIVTEGALLVGLIIFLLTEYGDTIIF
jgi:hypothetical protein